MAEDKRKLSRELSPEEAARELKGVDESLPEVATVHRRPLLSGRAVAGAEHRAGTEEETGEPPQEERPKQTLPPRGKKPAEGK